MNTEPVAYSDQDFLEGTEKIPKENTKPLLLYCLQTVLFAEHQARGPWPLPLPQSLLGDESGSPPTALLQIALPECIAMALAGHSVPAVRFIARFIAIMHTH